MARAKQYYESRYGLEVLATAPFGATDSYAIGELGPENATDAFTQYDRPEIDVLVLPGGNFPTMVHIAEWEARCGKPVLTTNQVVIWAVMAALGIDTPLAGVGRLLEELPIPAA